jgi:hypothetical protein
VAEWDVMGTHPGMSYSKTEQAGFADPHLRFVGGPTSTGSGRKKWVRPNKAARLAGCVPASDMANSLPEPHEVDWGSIPPGSSSQRSPKPS